MILPSILEYSNFDLEKRLNKLFELKSANNLFDLIKVSERKNRQELSLHLDFVLAQFAKDRVPILASLKPETVFNKLESEFSSTKLNLSVHLMGAIEDLSAAWHFFKTYQKPKNWHITLFLPQNHALRWKSEFKNYKIGVWLDLYEWFDSVKLVSKELDLSNYSDVLIMTVVAGKSGQSLTPQIQNNLIDFIDKPSNQKRQFVIDGGWNQEKAKIFLNHFENKIKIDFVAYGGFWGIVD